MNNQLGERAIVIGGSMAGLMAARVLADYFENVTVLERDHIEDHPSVHKSIPQGNQLHALLAGGCQALTRLYPEFTETLIDSGAVPVRMGKEGAVFLPEGKFYSFLGTLKEPRDLGFDFYNQSRALLEHSLRRLTRALKNVSFEPDCNVRELAYAIARISGVTCSPDGRDGAIQTIAADFVVDAGGRGSHAPAWLRQLGFAEPPTTVIGSDFAYAGAKFRLRGNGPDERGLLMPGRAPDLTRAAAAEQIEGGVWDLILGGRFGDFPPCDEAGFFAFAKSLYTPVFYDLIADAERVSEIIPHRFPTSFQRHYERLAEFPEGFLVIGDAISSFNPIYGQGMSSAALQAEALHRLLARRAEEDQGTEQIASEFFPKAAEVISTPWALAAGGDLAFPQTQGERPPNAAETAAYFASLSRLCAEDPDALLLGSQVFALIKPLSALFEEPLRSRVIKRMQASH
jgi:2-polyprenyl-6-methoxyphenol hydroxylase-like FAD-dependent oxidoreductase